MRMRVSDDLRAAIEPLANPDVQTPARSRCRRAMAAKPVRLFGRRRKREAGRPPGTLTDAERAGAIQSVQNGGDITAGEARSALSRGKIIAEANLQFLDRGAEAREVLLGKRRQCLHQDQAANVRGVGVRHRRERGESRHFVEAMQAAIFRVENNKNTPAVRKRQMADDRRRPGRFDRDRRRRPIRREKKVRCRCPSAFRAPD